MQKTGKGTNAMQDTIIKNDRLHPRSSEKIARVLLSLWCILPLFVCVFNVIGVLAGFLYIPDDLLQSGIYCYTLTITFYRACFFALGGATGLFSLICVIRSRRRLFRTESIRRAPWLFLFLALLVWAAISTALSDDPMAALLGGEYRSDGYISYLIYAGIFICASMIRSDAFKRRLLLLFGGVVCILSTIMLARQWCGGPLDRFFPPARAVVFNQFNHFGYVLCMAVLAFTGLYLYDRQSPRLMRAGFLAGMTLVSYTLLINNTFGSYLAAAVALIFAYVFYGLSGRRITPASLLPAVLFIAVSVLNYFGVFTELRELRENSLTFFRDNVNIITGSSDMDHAGTDRMILWKETIQRIGQRPLFGFGPEGFSGENAITDGKPPHNEYLQVAGYLGLPALLFYIGALVSLLVFCCRRRRRYSPMALAALGAAAAYLVSAVFGNPMFNTAPYLWLFLGLITVPGESDEPVICPEENLETSGGLTRTRKKLIAALCLIAVIIGLAGVWVALNRRTERNSEAADIELMHVAEASARWYIATQDPSETCSFWLDAGSFSLIPDTEPMPAGYGLGTARRGGGTSLYPDLADSYDEGISYTDKILAVTIIPESGLIVTEWVPAH